VVFNLFCLIAPAIFWPHLKLVGRKKFVCLLTKSIYYSVFSETLCKMLMINTIVDRRPRFHVDKIWGMRLKISFLLYHWICVNCVASSGEIQIFQERVVALQVSLTTGSLIITVSRGKPCWLSQYKCKVDLCVANWYSLAGEIIDFSYFPKFFSCFSLLKVSNRSMRAWEIYQNKSEVKGVHGENW